METEELPLTPEDDDWQDRYTLAGRIASLRYRIRRTTRRKSLMGCGAIVGFSAGAVFIALLIHLTGGG